MAPRNDAKYFNWALNGKLRNDIDALMIGINNFSRLINMRYVTDGIEGIAGMTKINASATSYLRVDNGFHFKKDYPSENHILVQTTTGANSRLLKSDNTAAVPAQDTFTAFKTLPNNNRVFFSDAPDGAMVAMDGTTNNIWGGNESRVGKFINYSADDTFWYDYSSHVTNTMQDIDNVATLHVDSSVADSYTKILIHANEADGTAGTSIIDSSTSAHTITAVGDAQVDTAQYKFRTGSVLFDGTGDYLTVPDHADWYFADQPFTIDTWMRITDRADESAICGQYADVNNYWAFGRSPAGMSVLDTTFYFVIKSGGVITAQYATDIIPAANYTANTWYHVQLVRNGADVYIFVNGVPQTFQSGGTAISTSEVPNLAAVLEIGANNNHTAVMKGHLDEFRISKGIARNVTNFTPESQPYASNSAKIYLGSTRPLQGATFYVLTPNTNTASCYSREWNGTSWDNLTITDGTSTGGKTLAATGKVSFASTEATSVQRLIKGVAGYWYQVEFSGISDGTQIYFVTVDAPMQSVKDIWNGTPRQCLQFYKATADAYTDLTNHIAGEYPYSSSLDYTYAQIGSLDVNDRIYLGFAEQQCGFRITMPDQTKCNTADCFMTVKYFDGNDFTTVGVVYDESSSTGKSFFHSGLVTFQPLGKGTEFSSDRLPAQTTTTQSSIFSGVSDWLKDIFPNLPQLPRIETVIGTSKVNGTVVSSQSYWYEISFSAQLSGEVRISAITGIPSPQVIPAHRFSLAWQNRLWLFNNQSQNKNAGWCSAYNTNCVFNGSDSGYIPFGNDEEVIAAEKMFSRYSGGIYDNLVVFKKNAMYIIDGLGPSDYKIFTIANSIGCVAPLTLKKCDIGYEIAPGISKHVLLFMSARGVELFDGNAPPNLVSQDISDYFDPRSSNYINVSMIDKFYGFVDERLMEYHLCFATGTSTTLNKEIVYDITQKKWFDVDRGTGKALNSGFNVTDTLGYKYTYGGTADGFIERLENGTTFDGNSIVHTVKTGESPLHSSLGYFTELHRMKLTAKSMATSTALVTIKHFGDGDSTGTSLDTTLQTDTKRYYQYRASVSKQAVNHAIEMTVTTTNEPCGFKPYFISGSYSVMREDL